MISYLVHYSWETPSAHGLGRSFVSFDFEPCSEDIIEAERMIADEHGQKIIILALTRIANSGVSK